MNYEKHNWLTDLLLFWQGLDRQCWKPFCFFTSENEMIQNTSQNVGIWVCILLKYERKWISPVWVSKVSLSKCVSLRRHFLVVQYYVSENSPHTQELKQKLIRVSFIVWGVYRQMQNIYDCRVLTVPPGTASYWCCRAVEWRAHTPLEWGYRETEMDHHQSAGEARN